MARAVQAKHLDSPDETRTFDRGILQTVTLGGFKAARAVLQPGWRWSEHVKPIAQTNSCQVEHTGVVLSGRLRVVMDGGSEMEIGPGDVYVIPPGHDAWVTSAQEFVGVDVSSETVEKFAKEAGAIDKAKDRLSD